jgi:hypothetical protein
MGQTRPLGDVGSISGLPPKAAVQRTLVDGSMECALDSGQFHGFDRLLGVAILVLRGAQIA